MIYYLNHCRDAIFLALKALQLPEGANVGLSLYNCQTVMSAVVAADCTPVFLDITPDYYLDLKDLQRKHEANHLQALMVTHLFGNINDVSAIQTIAPNIPIIEDCAHAWGYFTSAIGSTGSPTTVQNSQFKIHNSTFVSSLGLGKCLNLGPGGLLYTEDEAILSALNQLVKELPQISSFQNFILRLTLPLKRCLYRSFLPKTALWRRTRNFRHRRLNPWQPPHLMSPTVKQSFLNLHHSPFTIHHSPFTIHHPPFTIHNSPFTIHHSNLLLLPSYHNCLHWASQLGYSNLDCPTTEHLISTQKSHVF